MVQCKFTRKMKGNSSFSKFQQNNKKCQQNHDCGRKCKSPYSPSHPPERHHSPRLHANLHSSIIPYGHVVSSSHVATNGKPNVMDLKSKQGSHEKKNGRRLWMKSWLFNTKKSCTIRRSPVEVGSFVCFYPLFTTGFYIFQVVFCSRISEASTVRFLQ